MRKSSIIHTIFCEDGAAISLLKIRFLLIPYSIQKTRPHAARAGGLNNFSVRLSAGKKCKLTRIYAATNHFFSSNSPASMRW